MFKRSAKVLIVLDILFILLHLVWGKEMLWLNLDSERNLPTYYQGFKAIIVGLVLFRIHKFKLLGVMTGYVGFDEIFVIHERTENVFRSFIPGLTTDIITTAKEIGYRSVTWVILLSPVLVTIFIYGVRLLKRLSEEQRNVVVISMIFFGFAFLAEIVNTQSRIPVSVYHQLVALEEGCELLGISNLIRLSSVGKQID